MKKKRRLGLIIGGSGLIGGSLMHYFKTQTSGEIDVHSPNSKKVSLREPGDIRQYIEANRPDFIINTAIASIDSDPQMAFEVNYLGAISLAKEAIHAKIPYIHFSSAAAMPMGENLSEEDRLPLSADMPNYPKSKLMAELTLEHMHREKGLDFTNIRLGVVYGKHDHKIQGIHRLLYSIADQAMPVMLTMDGIFHSYSHSRKIPSFVHYILDHRQEFSGETYNFVDREAVELTRLIRTIRSYLGVKTPREIFVPYPLARFGKKSIKLLIRLLSRIGVAARMPAELMFLENFFKTQTLSSEKLRSSSYPDPDADITIFTYLPDIIEYYLTRWERLNLITSFNIDFFDPKKRAEEFLRTPEELLEKMHQEV